MLWMLLLASSVSFAGNPIFVRDDGPLRWDTASPVVWNPDGGSLGVWNGSTALFEVTAAFNLWQGVPTSSISYMRGSQITHPVTGTPIDVTSATFNLVVNATNGENPIIYDNNLDILTAVGLPQSVIGVATVLRNTGTQIDKSYALMNGDWIDGDPSDIGEISLDLFRFALLHELGHFSGLGHSSVNHELTSGIGACPAPTIDQLETMKPFSIGPETPGLHHDDEMILSHLYPSATFNSDHARIRGQILWRDATIPIDGANMILRPITGDCDTLYEMSQGTQAGVSPGEFGGKGFYEFPGLAPGGNYTLLSTSILDGGRYPLDAAIIDDDFWNLNEDYFNPPDDPSVADTVVAGAAGTTTAGFDININNPAGPGAIATQGADALTVTQLDGVTPLPGETLAVDIEFGLTQLDIPSGAQLAFVNRFAPTANQLPLRIERLEASFSRSQPITGRPIRLLVYQDLAATGDLANATLIYQEDFTIPAPSGGGAIPFDAYPLTTPVDISAGEFYVGFFDLVADAADAFPFYDQFVSGNAWTAIGSTTPGSFSAISDGNFYVRAHVTITPPANSLMLSWGDPCNVASFDGQDFAVYEGGFSSFGGMLDHQPIACSTGLRKSWIVPPGMDDRFFLVTPRVGPREGELGTGSGGSSRAPTTSCATTQADSCP